jgi:hypothetical protein
MKNNSLLVAVAFLLVLASANGVWAYGDETCFPDRSLGVQELSALRGEPVQKLVGQDGDEIWIFSVGDTGSTGIKRYFVIRNNQVIRQGLVPMQTP